MLTSLNQGAIDAKSTCTCMLEFCDQRVEFRVKDCNFGVIFNFCVAIIAGTS